MLNRTHFLMIVLLFGCTVPQKDFTDNPLEISFDKIQNVTWVKSNWISNFNEKRGGSINPYLGVQEKAIHVRFKLYSSATIFFHTVHFMCGTQKPIVRGRKAFENWSKDFHTYGEGADITLSAKQALEILKCDSSLTVRLSGDARKSEFEYTPNDDPNFFRGLKDLVEHLEELKKQGKTIARSS